MSQPNAKPNLENTAISKIEDRRKKRFQEPIVLTEGITEWDQEAYKKITSTELNTEQIDQVIKPHQNFPQQSAVVALHWHPEFIPIELIRKRVDAMFPNKREELIIPTDHNVLKSYDGVYTGVEVDCFSREFNRKVQLLIHFENSKIEDAGVLKAMLNHTLRYRSSQLFELLDSLVNPKWEHRIQLAAKTAGADDDLIRFVKVHATKLKNMLFQNETNTPMIHIKNKLIVNFLDMHLEFYDEKVISRAQYLVKLVKNYVKKDFSHEYFYQTQEIIDETRSLGGGIIVPHPEQFWPILLAEYDVDGYEVWNPQSREYTEFLINVVSKQNKTRARGNKPLLIFMGDDTHMGEKVKAPEQQNKEKASRQIGYQSAWEDLAIRKVLSIANTNRSRLIEEYKSRLY